MITTTASSSRHSAEHCALQKSVGFSAFVHSWLKVKAESPYALEANKCWNFKGLTRFVREGELRAEELGGAGPKPNEVTCIQDPSSCLGSKGAQIKHKTRITFLRCESPMEA